VGDAAGQLADGLHLLALVQLALQQLSLADVSRMAAVTRIPQDFEGVSMISSGKQSAALAAARAVIPCRSAGKGSRCAQSSAINRSAKPRG